MKRYKERVEIAKQENKFKRLLSFTKQDYDKLMKTGMFFVLYPEMTGNYTKDLEIAKEAFGGVYA